MRGPLGRHQTLLWSTDLYFLVYAVFPKSEHPEYGRVDGAYVSLFVNETN
jgi:hypothetical protein